MRKNLGAKAFLYPIHHTYRKLGDVVGNAFSDGKKLK